MKTNRIVQFLLISALVLSAFGCAAPQQAAVAKAQPELVELAAQNPGQRVRVIAQKVAGAQGLEAQVARLGGQVVADLSIINAFAAEMTAEAALELARSEDVRWVSLDAAVENTTTFSPVAATILPPNYYLDTLYVRRAWNMGLSGEGIAIAVIDSGISNDADFLKFDTGPGESFSLDSVSAEVAPQVVALDKQILAVAGGSVPCSCCSPGSERQRAGYTVLTEKPAS